MNILMIHGIGQEKREKYELQNLWTECIHKSAPGLLDGSDIEMAYYGKTLAGWTNGSAKDAIGMGIQPAEIKIADQNELKFLTVVMEEIAASNNIGETDIEDAIKTNNTIPMDSLFMRRFVGLIGAIEKISPAKGSLLLRLVRQGYTYLSSPGAGSAVDNIVRPYLKESPQILITHSLGTIIAFKLLREMDSKGLKIEIPLLITMGSPLGLEAFKKKLGPPRKKPSFVKRWVNFYDPSDLVALGRNLDASTFALDIENDGTVDNFTANAHGIIGYLPHKGVIDTLKSVL
ncbi:hypothetical protein [Pseudocitrobacter corydidari]|uniref:Alpha/beta hydrolase n=1 Tax=Pseudocitrobacter corydidari TaxID=2891570 RepID=A0ABY3S3T9_9ENTR|nr:hypothetical protein [Pseudocitrobacter corydidari]UGS41121.1 hypothetical protein G163CM_18220 [Pseudocitrobacter corydidari]